MTAMPEEETAIYFELGTNDSKIPAGKTVLDYSLDQLTPDGSRVLAENISLRIRGSEKICVIGKNGVGKTTLLKKIAKDLMERSDIRAEYMPQNYEDQLDLSLTPVEYLNTTGDKEEMTRIRTYLGALKWCSIRLIYITYKSCNLSLLWSPRECLICIIIRIQIHI